MLEKLVSFDTTSRDSNLKLINFVDKFFKKYQVNTKIIYNNDKSKANIHAIIGPKDVPGIVLSGHTDVVPVDNQKWNSNPFTLKSDGSLLYGRGTSDMKGFIAVILSFVPLLKESNLKIPIHFSLSYDEEVGCLGAPDIIKFIKNNYPKPIISIIGEPTNMNVVNSHKGIYAFKTSVFGEEGHSSNPTSGVNSIFYANKLISFLYQLSEDYKNKDTNNKRFHPPYTTIHVGLINGGTALNIIPKECYFLWEYRLIPGSDEKDIINKFNNFSENHILKSMKSSNNQSSIKTEEIALVPPLLPKDKSFAQNLIMKLLNTNNTYAVSYGTEAGLFQNNDFPSIICGPGSIEQAHKANEFIEISQIKKCEKFLLDIINYSIN
ncbi:acetylornithine deacetylase [Alphaproteobacteria bacterium]|nr:acetylornithine deacetylase [Alphaproteobacteria bacterium]